MRNVLLALQGKFWGLSAILFGPWHAPLLLAVVSRLTAGTAAGTYISAHYDLIRSVLLVVFSAYFVLAFMMWVVGRRTREPLSRDDRGATETQAVIGLSLKQVIGWGLVGMVMIPALVVMSSLGNRAYFVDTFRHVVGVEPAINAGLIWLLCISTVIMIPTMVIWLVWMWRAWVNTDDRPDETETWGYDYE